MDKDDKLIVKIVCGVLGGLLALGLFFGSYTRVPEGHIGVVKFWTRADYQITPGWNWKWPIANSVQLFDVRRKKAELEDIGISKERLSLPFTAVWNWEVDQNRVMELFVEYGSPEQYFERNVLPAMRQSAKSALGKAGVDDIFQDRDAVAAEMNRHLQKNLEGFPIKVFAGILADVKLPKKYKEQVLAKNNAREAVLREEFLLQKQKLQAEQTFQTAQADAKAVREAADAELYRLEKQAEGLATLRRQLSDDVVGYLFVDALRNGGLKLPDTLVMGGDEGLGGIIISPNKGGQ